MTKVILLIEDNKKLQIFNKVLLEKEGYGVENAYTLAEAREILARVNVTAIMLDIGMPDGNGLDFLKELRKTSKIPVLLLTGLGKSGDVVAGFESGCNDYLSKPYTPEVLLARLKYMLQSTEQMQDIIIKGSLRLEKTPSMMFINGRNVGTSPKEFSMLSFLAQHENETISTERIYEHVWGCPMNNDRGAVRKTVSRVRIIIDGSGYTITSMRKEGYRFERE